MDIFYENIGYTWNSRCAMKEHKVTEITLLRTHLLNSTTSGKKTQFIKPRAFANSDKAAFGFGSLPLQSFFFHQNMLGRHLCKSVFSIWNLSAKIS